MFYIFLYLFLGLKTFEVLQFDQLLLRQTTKIQQPVPAVAFLSRAIEVSARQQVVEYLCSIQTNRPTKSIFYISMLMHIKG